MHREEKKAIECVCLCQQIAGVFCRLDFTATVRADIPLVTQWMSYLVKGQWRFAKINHSCFSHSTPVEKKSLPSSGVAERERLGSCQFDTVSKIFSLTVCEVSHRCTQSLHHVSVFGTSYTLGSPRWRTMLIKWHVGCMNHSTQNDARMNAGKLNRMALYSMTTSLYMCCCCGISVSFYCKAIVDIIKSSSCHSDPNDDMMMHCPMSEMQHKSAL